MKMSLIVYLALMGSSAFANGLCEKEARFAMISAVAGIQEAEKGFEVDNFQVFMGGYYSQLISDDLIQWTGRHPDASVTQKRNVVYNIHAMSTGAVSLIGTVTVEANLDGRRRATCSVKSLQLADI